MKKIFIALMVLAVVCSSAFATTVYLTNSVAAGEGINVPTEGVIDGSKTAGYHIVLFKGTNAKNDTAGTAVTSGDTVTSLNVQEAGDYYFTVKYNGNEAALNRRKVSISSTAWSLNGEGSTDADKSVAITTSANVAGKNDAVTATAAGSVLTLAPAELALVKDPVVAGGFKLAWAAPTQTLVAGDYKATVTVTVAAV